MEPLHPTDPAQVGKYRLTARLGAGGMGQVYLARTPSGRKLVIKVIRPELASEDGFRARFAREADAARRVGGFHTAQVVDADPTADPPWIATAHISGPTLAQAIRARGPLPSPTMHVLAAGITEGLDAIHRCKLVHRDLKPANIILSSDGPRIIDFGITRPLDVDSMTPHDAVFGTLPYMSPEQTESSRVGPTSDVFSLGTVLAFAATGVSPFSGATMAETLHRILSPPPDLGDLDPTIRALIHDCWNHDPTRRPIPHQILDRFAAHDLHSSWPLPHTARPFPATAYPSVAPAPVATDQVTTVPVADPVGTWKQTKFQTAVPRPPDTTKTIPGRGTPKQKKVLYIGATAATAIVIVFLLMLRTLDIGSDDGIAQSGGPHTGGAIPLTEHTSDVNTVAFHPDGSTLATASSDGTTRLWNTETGDHITTFHGHTNTVNSVAFHPDGTILATAGDDNTARLWNTETGDRITTFHGHTGYVNSVAFDPDGSTLATAGSDGTTRLWNTETGDHITTFHGHTGAVRSVAFDPDGSTLATAGDDGTARLWNIETGEQTTTFEEHTDAVWSVAFHPDGSTLATAGDDDTARLRDID